MDSVVFGPKPLSRNGIFSHFNLFSLGKMGEKFQEIFMKIVNKLVLQKIFFWGKILVISIKRIKREKLTFLCKKKTKQLFLKISR